MVGLGFLLAQGRALRACNMGWLVFEQLLDTVELELENICYRGGHRWDPVAFWTFGPGLERGGCMHHYYYVQIRSIRLQYTMIVKGKAMLF